MPRTASSFLQSEFAKLGIDVKLRMADSAVISPAMFRGNYDAMFRNIMSPGEATYFLSQNFLPNQFMSDVGGYYEPEDRRAPQGRLRGERQDEVEAGLRRDHAAVWPTSRLSSWVGYFNATNLWRKASWRLQAEPGIDHQHP